MTEQIAAPSVGIALPGANTTIAAELPVALPGAVVELRPFAPPADPAELPQVLAAAAEGIAGPVVIGYATGSYQLGRAADLEAQSLIADRLGVPVVSAGTAMLDDLERLGARSVTVVSPYRAEVNEAAQRYFAEAGLDARVAGEALAVRAGSLDRDAVLELVVGHARDLPGDVVLVSCTGLRTLDVLDEAAEALGRPVLGTNPVLYRLIGRLLADQGAR